MHPTCVTLSCAMPAVGRIEPRSTGPLCRGCLLDEFEKRSTTEPYFTFIGVGAT